ncbi:hypothetical protein RF11_06238 [Thelohanellus kitauei]|uniref:Uncharacterized protein n=1 Tax=Thelohanellus kitauei TaxID=669202 RepID=A0A0C2M9N4_THEKT|nr:hypothetical protein RF11_06238 [Thelohanellus kitauei]
MKQLGPLPNDFKDGAEHVFMYIRVVYNTYMALTKTLRDLSPLVHPMQDSNHRCIGFTNQLTPFLCLLHNHGDVFLGYCEDREKFYGSQLNLVVNRSKNRGK